MKKTLLFLASAAVLAACASPEKMAKMSENVTVECVPATLEVVAGNIDATVSVTYPKDYFNPQVILEVTPVIVYEGGEAAMPAFKYQGEKVKDNYKVVSSDGQTVTENVHFQYVEGMEKCHLELRGNVIAKNKVIALPTKKVTDGANTTYMLVKRNGKLSFKAGDYQDVVPGTIEAQIKYALNSSEVRGSQLKSNSVKDFKAALAAADADERVTVKGTEIIAYASPDGSVELNDKLSKNRSGSAGKAWKKVTKGTNAAEPEIRSVGEDWEGFQQLVSESDLSDKELILRVLSMYSDPAVRENEIKNMSQVYTALKDEVLPELRRARLIANVERQNFTNEELATLLNTNEDVLDEEALLRLAYVTEDCAQKENIWKKAVAKFNSDRAQYNLAALYLLKGEDAKAEEALAKVKATDADVINAKGVLALHKNDFAAAENLFRKAANDDAKANLGVALILQGRYEEALAQLKDVKGCCNNLVLAYILNDQPEKAIATAKCQDPCVAYLKAVASARLGKAEDVKANLQKAFEKPALKERAARDIEFAGYEF